jgi:hypothetical protein
MGKDNMNKKILIGSIIAVAVLIGVSFTSVVGYRSVASDVKASPLFNIRSIRAIDEESEDFTFEYVGKGEVSIIPLPTRDNETILIQQAINGIRKMNEGEFNQFVLFTINKLICENEINEKDIPQIKNLLILLKNNPEGFFKTLHNKCRNDKILYSKDNNCLTMPPFQCLLAIIFIVLFLPIIAIALVILEYIDMFLYWLTIKC